jgi:methylenetetrahydrofolate dehydrogenase (NADP+)/methenyltetrahydrofolate cyclohydrolase
MRRNNMGSIIDGKKIAGELRQEFKDKVKNLKDDGRVPGLSVILVGDDPASQTYVSMKEKDAEEIGIYSDMHYLEKDTTQKELLNLIDYLNN